MIKPLKKCTHTIIVTEDAFVKISNLRTDCANMLLEEIYHLILKDSSSEQFVSPLKAEFEYEIFADPNRHDLSLYLHDNCGRNER